MSTNTIKQGYSDEVLYTMRDGLWCAMVSGRT